MNDFMKHTIDEFRANGGKVGGMFEGAPLLLLHHVGAKTAAKRVNPLMYQAVDGGYAVFASAGGADTNPDWFYNVQANPETKIEVGTETLAVTVRVAEGDEHDTIWRSQKQDWPQFAEYEEKTARSAIPVLVIETS